MDNVIITNKEELDKKIESIRKEGPNKILVLADFNKTFTKAFINGKKVPSLIAQLRNGKYLTKDYAYRANGLYDKYHPIEISKEISLEEKKAKMREWWLTHYNLLVDSGLDKETINQAVEDMIKEGRDFRTGMQDFLERLNLNNIPVIIMSAAGIGNMVTLFMKKRNLYFSNVYFIGNTLNFDENGKFTGIEHDKIIHVLNKQAIEIKNLPIYEKIKDKENIILLGDSLDDLDIIKDFTYRNIIKIGFLNEEPEKNLEEFKKNFDIIILDDGSMQPINDILKRILD